MDYWKIIWNDFKNGDNGAFEKIYYKNIEVLFRYGTKIANDRDLVKDCIQQLFLELISSRTKLSDPENIELYLLKALKRIIFHKVTESKKHNLFSETDLLGFEIELDYESHTILTEEKQSKMKLLNEAMLTLSHEKKEMLFLKFYTGLNNQQIASMLGLKPDTVQKQIYRILKSLHIRFVDKFIELFMVCFRA